MLEFYSSKNQIANIFTKSIKVEALLKLKKMIGMIKFEELGLREAT